jgi:predicted  nucleic acid-binding Zn-ribbon protein
MLDHPTDSPSMLRYGLCALVCLPLLALSGSPASALPRAQADPTPGLLLVQGGPPRAEQQAHEDRAAPFADLDDVLRATRLKLEELTEATARLAADTRRRKEMQALQKDNERLAAELGEVRARQTDLEGSRELAEARIAELTESIDAARQEAIRLDEALVKVRGQNERLDERLTRADAARLAALDEVKQTRAEMAKKLKAAANEVAQAEAELVRHREKLEINHRKLAEADGAREQIEARVIAMEKRVKRSGAEAERLAAELAEAKEQLTQAAAAAVAAERARQAAGHEADRLRREAEQARKELTAARTESARLQIANAELERQVHSLRRDLTSATATARQNLIVMEEKIDELNAALDPAQPEEAQPAESPQAEPDAIEQEPDATLPQAPSAMAQPPAPESTLGAKPSSVSPTTASIEGAAVKAANVELEKLINSLVADSAPAIGMARPAPITTQEAIEQVSAGLAASRPEEAAMTGSAMVKPEAVWENRDAAESQAPSGIAQSPAPGSVTNIRADRPAGSATKLAMAGPTEPSLVDSTVQLLNAHLQALNKLELNAGGSNLFSGVESANGTEVRVSTTAAWDTLPPVGRESYIEALLEYWVAARGGKGLAVVRIVDSSGRVLAAKSSP